MGVVPFKVWISKDFLPFPRLENIVKASTETIRISFVSSIWYWNRTSIEFFNFVSNLPASAPGSQALQQTWVAERPFCFFSKRFTRASRANFQNNNATSTFEIMSKKIRENATVKAKTAANRDNLTSFFLQYLFYNIIRVIKADYQAYQ